MDKEAISYTIETAEPLSKEATQALRRYYEALDAGAPTAELRRLSLLARSHFKALSRPASSHCTGARSANLSGNSMIDENNDGRTVHHAACHCGTVRFTLRLIDGLRTARRCNCSLCSMRGAVAVSANLSDITVTHGKEALTLYQFNTHEAKHYFCSKCGIYTFHQRRSKPDQYGVNAACIEGIDPFDFPKVPVYEGRIHPKDRGGGDLEIAGWLRYES